MTAERRKAAVAVDLGAQSCRVSLLQWSGAEPATREVHRFPNGPRATTNGLRWDIERIFQGVLRGLHEAAALAPEGIGSIGIDGWAVDYVRLNQMGEAADQPYCYRDVRTEAAEAGLHEVLTPARLYELTGIQILRINTLYQLYADKLAGGDPHMPWLNLPEYVSYRLGGRRVAEYTNATHTGLVALGQARWREEIFCATGFDLAAAPEIVPSGTMIGTLRDEFADAKGLRGAQIVVPACHDTASAIAAIPASGEDWAFISSGTWSLVGTVLRAPYVTEQARDMNFTNLGGVGGRICFLKNVNGMWLLRQCLEELGVRSDERTLAELLCTCETAAQPKHTVDVDDAELMVPGGMIAKLNGQLVQKGARQLGTQNTDAVEIASLILHSLAARYADVLAAVAEITGKRLRRLYIVGGGSKNRLLNRLTADRTGLEVIAGSAESTTIGNFAVQMAAQSAESRSGVSVEAVAGWSERLLTRDLTLGAARQ